MPEARSGVTVIKPRFEPGDVVYIHRAEGLFLQECRVVQQDDERGVELVPQGQWDSRWVMPSVVVPSVSLRERINKKVLDPRCARLAIQCCVDQGVDVDFRAPV